jgi:D-alanyl-D-alanine carboxypeptidase/D-alanyl-D-alanine-endopeptidase (penicillin-binding protein 4)
MWKNLIIILLTISLVAMTVLHLKELFPAQATSIGDPPQPPALEPEKEPKIDPTLAVLHAMKAAPGFQAASIGFCLLADSMSPLVAYHANEAMTPASTLKAITSATALEQLGSDFRFTTQLASTKPIIIDPEGNFDGDLVLTGGGDPMLTSKTFLQWAQELQGLGLTTITGNLIADAQHFPEQMIPNAWDWGDVSNYYGAGPSGLNLDFNRFTIHFKSGSSIGALPSYELTPLIPWLHVQNFSRTVAKTASSWTSAYGGPYGDTLTLRGHIPLGSDSVACHAAIPDPAHYATWVFQKALENVGITLKGTRTTQRQLTLAKKTTINAHHTIKTHVSAPLPEIIRYLHRTSDNMVTECLFQTLIKRDVDHESGVDSVKTHWRQRGLNLQGLRMEDGSGLARADFIRPSDMASVLWLTRRGDQGDRYFETLNQYHGGRVRWKGGSMSRVRGYTGFAQADDGKEYTFALLINNYEADSDAIAHWRGRLIESILAGR